MLRWHWPFSLSLAFLGLAAATLGLLLGSWLLTAIGATYAGAEFAVTAWRQSQGT